MRLPLALAILTGVFSLLLSASTPRAHAGTQRVDVVCSRDVALFVDALVEIDLHLEIGVNYRKYQSLLLTANRAYRRMNVKAQSLACVSQVSVPAERALNAYFRALKAWRVCIERLTCDSPASEEKRQREWRIAHANIARAERNLTRG